MILTGNEIRKQVLNKKIIINPFIEENLNPNSYNYRLGEVILEIEADTIDSKKEVKFKKINLTNQGYILYPNRLYLASTVEEIGSDYFVTQLIGRSSVGRLGLFLQITAPLGHVGAKHCWTLELKAVQPIKVYPFMKIGQVSFWEMHGSKELYYKGGYQNFSTPHISEFYNKLNKNF